MDLDLVNSPLKGGLDRVNGFILALNPNLHQMNIDMNSGLQYIDNECFL